LAVWWKLQNKRKPRLPGEAFSCLVKKLPLLSIFSVRDDYRMNDPATHWRQARYTWHRDGCTVETGYFSYDYQEDASPVSIEILK
jgi:hypothetical protein